MKPLVLALTVLSILASSTFAQETAGKTNARTQTVSYYSSHERHKSRIYLAKVKLPPRR